MTPYAARGGSGGYAEFVFRHAARELYGVVLTPEEVAARWRQGRNSDIAELALEVEGTPGLKVAMAYGFRNIQFVVNKLRRGRCEFDFVEIMACPSGCLNGGAQLKPAGETVSARRARVERVGAVFAEACTHREPEDAPLVRSLYAQVLGGAPFSAEARRLMHTSYHAVPKMEAAKPEGIRW